MNRKQFILLLLVLAVLGGACLVLLRRNQESWSAPVAKMGDKVLPNFQPNLVAAIHITGESEVHVERKDDVWCVRERDDYPANFGQISDTLIKLRDLKVVEAYGVGPADLSRVNLDAPGKGGASGTLLEFLDAQGKPLAGLLLGKKHILETSSSPLANGSADGRYILLPSDPKNVFLISDALASLLSNPQAWLSRKFFQPEKVKSIALAANEAANSWKISRESESLPWMLADAAPGEELDVGKTKQAANALLFPNFTDVAARADPAQTGLDKPRVVSVETFDGFSYTLKIGVKSPAGTYPMTVGVAAKIPSERAAGTNEKPEDKMKLAQEFLKRTKALQEKLANEQALAPWLYSVNAWLLDPLLRDRAQMLSGQRAASPGAGLVSTNEIPPTKN